MVGPLDLVGGEARPAGEPDLRGSQTCGVSETPQVFVAREAVLVVPGFGLGAADADAAGRGA